MSCTVEQSQKAQSQGARKARLLVAWETCPSQQKRAAMAETMSDEDATLLLEALRECAARV